MSSKFKLVFFVPTASLDAVKKAVFAAGAGRYPGPGNYTECAWQTLGTGQFRPGDAANPNIGKVGVLEHVEEVRVETLCVGEEVARKAVDALKKCDCPAMWMHSGLQARDMSADTWHRAHPYEEPGYDVYRLEDF